MVRAAAARPSSYDDDASASLTSSSPSPVSLKSSHDGPPRERRRGKGVPKPKSEKRAAANRLNAGKSTGPRTAAGRAASRFNALRHGLCARVVLLPGEDRRDYEAFAELFADDLKPRGVMQEMLAGRAAAIAWALRRLPDAATDLAGRGEDRRFQRWFHHRGLRNKYDVAFSLEERGARELPAGRRAWAKRADAELADAAADGDPAPADRDAAGIVADALAGDEALPRSSSSRNTSGGCGRRCCPSSALERRQKLDGRAGGEDGDGEDDVEDDGDGPGAGEAEELDRTGRAEAEPEPADANPPAGAARVDDDPTDAHRR